MPNNELMPETDVIDERTISSEMTDETEITDAEFAAIKNDILSITTDIEEQLKTDKDIQVMDKAA